MTCSEMLVHETNRLQVNSNKWTGFPFNYMSETAKLKAFIFDQIGLGLGFQSQGNLLLNWIALSIPETMNEVYRGTQPCDFILTPTKSC